jgi:hypothetical protein
MLAPAACTRLRTRTGSSRDLFSKAPMPRVFDSFLKHLLSHVPTCSGNNKNNVVSVDARMVLRLTDSIDGLHKGCVVLAMFPDTTSFYR